MIVYYTTFDHEEAAYSDDVPSQFDFYFLISYFSMHNY